MLTGAMLSQVEQLIEEAFARRPQPFTPEKSDQLEYAASTVSRMTQDQSLGRVLGGSLWLSGVSVLDGTITADKLTVNSVDAITVNTGSLNVTGTITAAASYPATAARIDISSTGIKGYNSSVVQSFGFNTDGSGFIGVGATAMSWTTGGVVTIPVASIGSLTIAAVGSGTLGGTYQTSASSTRLEFSSSYFRALSGGTETFKLDASTGAMTATGSFTVLSAASGAHTKIDAAGGIAGYNATSESTSTRTFLLNAATGAGHLGLSTGSNQGISWDASGVVSIGGVSFSGGKIQAGSLSVSTLSAITADLGTITAGTITSATFRSSASNPKAQMDTSGFASYDASGNQRVALSNTGSGWLGSSSTLSWTTAGAVTIAGWTANSTSFTGGSVTLASDGNITVGTSNNVVRMSTTDASNRFWIGHATSTSAPFRVTSTGAVTIEGSSAFTIQSASSGSRVALSAANGLRIFNAGTLRAELAADGSGFLGSTDGTSVNAAISWTTGGTATINASRITVGTMTFGSSGTINTTGSISGTLGNINLANLTVTGNITLGSGGKIIDNDGSYWDQDGIVFFSPGTLGDTLIWRYSGWSSNRPNSYIQSAGSSTFTQLFVGSAYGNGSAFSNNITMSFTANSSDGILDIFGDPTTHPATVSSGAQTGIRIRANDTNTTSLVSAYVHGRGIMDLEYTDYRAKFGGRIFPGNAGFQTTGYFAWDGSNIITAGADFYVSANYLRIVQSGTSGSGALPSPTNFIKVKDSGGNIRRVPTWQDADTWAA